MIFKSIFTAGLLLSALICHAQWTFGLGAGAALPITGYHDVVKTGWLLNGSEQYRFHDNLALGLQVQFANFQKDRNPDDQFQQARMTIVPILFTADYPFTKNRLQPFVTGGIGISIFNSHFSNSTAINNISFTMMPQVGLRYASSTHAYIFIQSGAILITDGPPTNFPQSDKMTGYVGINAGVNWRF